MAAGISAWRLEKSKRHSCLQEGQEGGPKELEDSQTRLDL